MRARWPLKRVDWREWLMDIDKRYPKRRKPRARTV